MKYIFLHIPKTAGTTLRYTIKANCKANEFCEGDEEELNWTKKTKTHRQRIKYVMGHLYFGVHEQINDDCTYITLLRDPIERVLSFYYYVLKDSNDPLYDFAHNNTLEQFVEKGTSIVHNQQAKLINGDKDKDPDLDQVKEHINEHFYFVGLAEEYNKTVDYLASVLGWDKVLKSRLNANASRRKASELPQRTIDLIREYNQKDIELYVWAQQRFYHQIQL